MPITPQESLAPAWPVVKLSDCPPFPRSSSSAWTWEQKTSNGAAEIKHVSALTQLRTYHHRASENAVGTSERDLIITDVHLRLSVRARHDVSQVARVPLHVRWPTVLLARRVEVRSSAHAPCARIRTESGLAATTPSRVSSRSLTSCVVTELVDVETVLPRCETAHGTRYPRGSVALQLHTWEANA